MCPQPQLSGLHSRSETLVQLTRDYDRGRARLTDVEDQIRLDTLRIIELQEKLGFEYLTDGALAWQDPLRPLTRALEGVVTGVRYSRWFDTNTFYQKPRITGKISKRDFESSEIVRTDLLPRGRKWKVSIPGPYTFSELSENKHYTDKSELVLNVAQAEREIITQLATAGISLVQLSEPCLVYRPYRENVLDTSERELALTAIELISENAPLDVQVHTFFGDSAPVLQSLLETPVSAVGFDAYETHLSGLEFNTDKKIVLGVVDARESFIEDSGWIAETVRGFAKQIQASEWVLSPNSDLKYVPREIADHKVEALAAAANILKGD